ncbi:MAG: protein kinase, partial [Candidatus Obscuribacterales bacterium]|nr:protein kinase [Candidatus Obscuribacterales bacterium]
NASGIAERYEILGALTHGGSSIVYRARDKTLDELVAIKTLNIQDLDEQTFERFKQEASVLSGFEHPGIVKILDFGKTKSGKPYIVLEFIEAVSFDQYLKEHAALDQSAILDIFIDICAAMRHVHSHDVIHTDLTPGNIVILEEEDQKPQAIVMDFALAGLRTEAAPGMIMTPQRNFIGSPLYMSPEQIENLDIDLRTDIYSLGCVLFEALSARPPYKGTNLRQTMKMHLSEPVARLDPVAKDEAKQERLQALIDSCLAKNPEARFSDMEALEQELRILSDDLRPPDRKKEKKAQLQSSSRGIGPGAIILPTGIATALLLIISLTMNSQHSKIMQQGDQPVTNFSYKKALNLESLPIAKKEIDLANNNLDNVDLSHLAKIEPRVLNLTNTGVSEQQLSTIASLTSLRELNCSNNKLSKKGLANLSNLPALKKLDLSSVPLNESYMAILKSFPTLNTIILDKTNITSSNIEDLLNDSNIEEVSVADCPKLTAIELESIRADHCHCKILSGQ